ncbi:hypothetical protein H8356DRAFT_1436631 [Neocallimastix lanati (nom. inval.)]|nr:hypothetical protein H8356DRAFT_1436631 [Neocallimastix sp. JGI-2020a]
MDPRYEYVHENFLLKIEISKIKNKEINKHTKIKYNKNVVYDSKVTEEMLEEDRNAKFIVIQSISLNQWKN